MKKTTTIPNTPNSFYMKGNSKTEYSQTIIIEF
jgi:hypothetical protein